VREPGGLAGLGLEPRGREGKAGPLGPERREGDVFVFIFFFYFKAFSKSFKSK
jgi:hypothetical protein